MFSIHSFKVNSRKKVFKHVINIKCAFRFVYISLFNHASDTFVKLDAMLNATMQS